jgi:fatty acid desaturase
LIHVRLHGESFGGFQNHAQVLTAVYDGFLTPFFLSQNYHNIHHLYPFLPFYHYGAVWRKHKVELIKRGTRVLPIFLRGGRDRYLAELGSHALPASQHSPLLSADGALDAGDEHLKTR